MSIKKKIIFGITGFTLSAGIILAAVVGYFYYQLGAINHVEITKTNKALGIGKEMESKQEGQKSGDKVINIALFGVDSGRAKYEAVHSDAIIILTIDEKNKKFKLSSIMRDSYVKIEEYGKTKINTAYAVGGPQLAIKTINQNYNLDIKDFITVDFAGLEDIINALGGIKLNVKSYEINEINKYERELARLRKKEATPLKASGKRLLNGRQAVAYARIRKVGNGDFQRTERQKNVLVAIGKKLQNTGMIKMASKISKLAPYIKTSMSPSEMLKLGSEVYTQGIKKTEWVRFPIDGYCDAAIIKGIWYLTFNKKDTERQLHAFIYDDIKPVSKTPLF